MKRIILTLSCILAAVFSAPAQSPKPGAMTLDQEVASVELTKRAPISLMTLKADIARMEGLLGKKLTVDERRQYLDLMVNDILFLQYCEGEGKISVTDAEVNAVVQQMKAQLAASAQSNPSAFDKATLTNWASAGSISDDSFYDYMSKLGVKSADLKVYVRKRLLLQKYIQGQRDRVAAATQPTYDDIAAYYEKNKADLVRPDTIVLGILFFDTRGKDEKERRNIKDQAESVARKVKDAPAKFDEYVLRSKDKGQAFVGEPSYVFTKGEEYKALFGEPFYNAAFSLKKGQISGLVEGPNGFHILKAVDFYPSRTLELTDPITLGEAGTVHEFIRATLYQENVNRMMQDILNKLVKDLRARAKIRVRDELLAW